MTKATVISAINELPKDFSLDQLIERLLVIEKIDSALTEVKNGEFISHADVKKLVSKWSK
jgi:hypothetical protein